MADKVLCHELPAEFLSEFQDKLRFAEEKYRYTTDPSVKINGLLRELALFYDADRAFLVEMDWDLGVGVCTYAHCDDGTDPQKNVTQHIPIEHFSVWLKKIKSNQPSIIDIESLDVDESLRQKSVWNGMKTVLVVPFSNRFNTGLIAIGNPKRYAQNLSFMLILGYAVVSALNEIKLQERVDIAIKQISSQTENEIYVNCFGGLEIKHSRGVLTDEIITSDQCYRLLAYLICNHKKSRPVRELADIIWNDVPINDPYRDLKNVVYRLKRFLSTVELDDLVIGSGGTFVINPKYRIYTDFNRFEEVCTRYFNEAKRELKDSTFQIAVDMYKGLLLPRCDHVHWFIPRIGYYQTLYLRLMKAYISQKLSDADYLAVQKIAMEGLAAEPYDTDFIMYQIIGMYALGNRSLARNYYNWIESELTEEQKALIKTYRR